jgi:hypothetical protein
MVRIVETDFIRADAAWHTVMAIGDALTWFPGGA